jgi:hypothetical protein
VIVKPSGPHREEVKSAMSFGLSSESARSLFTSSMALMKRGREPLDTFGLWDNGWCGESPGVESSSKLKFSYSDEDRDGPGAIEDLLKVSAWSQVT